MSELPFHRPQAAAYYLLGEEIALRSFDRVHLYPAGSTTVQFLDEMPRITELAARFASGGATASSQIDIKPGRLDLASPTRAPAKVTA